MQLIDKRVLVTGGAGFLGSHVIQRLKAAGCTDLCVPRSREYDLTLRADIDSLFEMHRPQVVIHMAARVGGIGANRANPATFFYDNAMMGIQLIEACRHFGVEKTVVLGTICAYPKFTPVPFVEESLWNGYPEETNAPYGMAKKALLVQCQAYRQQYGMNAIYLLPVNLYGPGDNFDIESSHVIPALIRKCIEAVDTGANEVVCWGDGSPTREFLYVEDCAEAIIAATQRYNKAEPINVGSGQEISIRSLSKKIAELTGFSGRFLWDASQPNGQPRRCLEVDRAQREFGFRARTSFDEGLERTIHWYRCSLSREPSPSETHDVAHISASA